MWGRRMRRMAMVASLIAAPVAVTVGVRASAAVPSPMICESSMASLTGPSDPYVHWSGTGVCTVGASVQDVTWTATNQGVPGYLNGTAPPFADAVLTLTNDVTGTVTTLSDVWTFTNGDPFGGGQFTIGPSAAGTTGLGTTDPTGTVDNIVWVQTF